MTAPVACRATLAGTVGRLPNSSPSVTNDQTTVAGKSFVTKLVWADQGFVLGGQPPQNLAGLGPHGI
jgi:hypothetical protein